jgi:hypothetical protein
MKKLLAAGALIVASLATPASAHRVDEYLQATLISLEKDQVEVFLRLTPGIAVSSAVLSSIDTDSDGVISETERRAYADRVLADLSVMVDGNRLTPRLVSVDFPEVEEMKEGLGEIRIAFIVELHRSAHNRRLVLENHHQNQIAAYLVNCLTPRDRNIRVIAQNRNEDQSFYQLDYVQDGAGSGSPYLKWWSGVDGWTRAAAISLFGGILLLSRQVLLAIFRGA